MHNQRGAPGRRENNPPKTPSLSANRRGGEPDVNRERLVFILASLVGHRVTAKLRNNILYEGLFHSCCLDQGPGDFSITLKCARQLPSEDAKSGEVIPTLLIPGKDFLQVSAQDVPPPQNLPSLDGSRSGAAGFEVDSEITAKKASAPGSERELVAWRGPEGETPADALETLGEGGRRGDDGHWDQFERNEALYGVTTTYSDELYTTKLDPTQIPREKREEAERIAREIERSGGMRSEVEGHIEGEDDEEGNFSAVTGTGAYKAATPAGGVRGQELAGTGAAGPSARCGATSKAPSLAPMPLTKEHLSHHEALQGGPGDGAAYSNQRDLALRKRSLIQGLSPNSPMRSPMISEMKGINALNLEPALPKLDDKTRNDWINFKQAQSRGGAQTNGQSQANGLKMEFQQSLEVIQQRTASKQQQQQQRSAASSGGGGASGSAAGQGVVVYPKGAGAAPSPTSSSFKLNPAAKEFSFSPTAASFTPGGGGGPPPNQQQNQANAANMPKQGQAQPQQVAPPMPKGGTAPKAGGAGVVPLAGGNNPLAKAGGPAKAPAVVPQFASFPVTAMVKTPLIEILDGFFDRAIREPPESVGPEWVDAQGPSYHEVLGQPQPGQPLPQMGGVSGGPGMPAGPGMPGNMGQGGGGGGGGNQGSGMPSGWQPAPGQMPGQMPGQLPSGMPVQMGAMGGGPGGPMGQPQMMQMQMMQIPAGGMPAGGMPAGSPGQMYTQMYAAQAGQAIPMQGRPNNGAGAPTMQGGQQATMMVFNPQQMQQQQQQQPGMSGNMAGNMAGNMVGNQGQPMGMQGVIVPPQGAQNPDGMSMGSMPQFGGQGMATMLIPEGQYPPQGFVPQQAMQWAQQGQNQQGGPQGCGPQQGQMMTQQMFHRGMGGGAPNQMSGHDGG